MSLLRFNPGIDARPLVTAAGRRGLPLEVVDVASVEGRELYGRDLVLVRPDHHVARRGDSLPEAPGELLAFAAGYD